MIRHNEWFRSFKVGCVCLAELNAIQAIHTLHFHETRGNHRVKRLLANFDPVRPSPLENSLKKRKRAYAHLNAANTRFAMKYDVLVLREAACTPSALEGCTRLLK